MHFFMTKLIADQLNHHQTKVETVGAAPVSINQSLEAYANGHIKLSTL